MNEEIGQIKPAPRVDFLCIGAQRSGTTWLAGNLRLMPDIWLPPLKELHYFSRSPKYSSPSHLSVLGDFNRLFGASGESKTWRRFVAERIPKLMARAPAGQKARRFKWCLRYFFQNPDDEWYLELFREGTGRITGELTPAYSLLDESDVESLTHILPRIKVILLMRDPLDRVLSQVRYHMDGKAYPILRDAREDQLVQFATEPGQVMRGDYGRILAIWRKFVPPENIFLGFYEDILNQPAEMLNGIQEFLEVENKISLDGELLAERRNATTPQKFSENFLRRIAPVHERAIRGCAKALGQPAARWLERFEKLMNR